VNTHKKNSGKWADITLRGEEVMPRAPGRKKEQAAQANRKMRETGVNPLTMR